jgi:hypothetical protein
MKNMQDIKKVLESQGNMHNMVEVQANSESRSLTSSPTQSLAFKLMCRTCPTSNLGDLYMHGKIRR